MLAGEDMNNITVEDHAPIYILRHKDGRSWTLWTTDMKLLAKRIKAHQ
jgi:hypothetical protein